MIAFSIITHCVVTDENWDTMIRLWSTFARVHNKNRLIQIYLEGPSRQTMSALDDMDIEVLPIKKMHLDGISKSSQLRMSKISTLCNHNSPYIFVDTDTYILCDLEVLFSECTAAISGALHHETQYVKKHGNCVNSGVLVVKDPAVFSFKRCLDYGKKYAWKFQKDDQGMINDLFFQKISSENIFPNIYNTKAKLTYYTKQEEKLVPLIRKESLPPTYPKNSPAKIVHFYGKGQKPWEVEDPIFLSFQTSGNL